jgi:hypothetical protein
MMKKRILISALSLLFLVSTTGLPVTIKLCKMAEGMDSSECTMHHKPVKSLCCAKQTNDNSNTISYDKPDCCQIEFVYNKVSDEFIYNKSELNNFSSSGFLIQVTTILIPSGSYADNISFPCDSSPPFLINSELNITNSIFLI